MNFRPIVRFHCVLAFCFTVLPLAAIHSAETNSLGVPLPRQDSQSRDGKTLIKYEKQAEEYAHKDRLQDAARWWSAYYKTASQNAATSPHFAEHAVYAAQTLVALNCKLANTKDLNLDGLANSVNAVVFNSSKAFAQSQPALLRTRLTPEVDRFLRFYEERLEAPKPDPSMPGWPYQASFDTAIEIRTSLGRFDPQKAAQHWKIEFVYAQALCSFLREDFRLKSNGRVNLQRLQEALATANKLRFKSANETHRALMVRTLHELRDTIQRALTANQVPDADALFNEVLALTKDRQEWQGSPLAIAMELESTRPGFGKRYVDEVRGQSRKTAGAETDPVLAALEKKAASEGIDAVTLEVREEKRRGLEASGREAEALQLDQLTIEQCVKVLQGDLDDLSGVGSLVQGMKEASKRLGRALCNPSSGLSTSDAQVELLSKVARLLVDRTFTQEETPGILDKYAEVASLPPVSPAARYLIEYEICRMNWLAHKTDFEALERVRKSVVELDVKPVREDAALAFFFVALSAEKAAKWDMVDEFISRSLQVSGVPNDPKARSWHVERMLMRALALRHTKGASEEEHMLKEALTVAGQCDPDIAPAIGYVIRERLRRIKSSGQPSGAAPYPQKAK